jgi:hypothetical protein
VFCDGGQRIATLDRRPEQALCSSGILHHLPELRYRLFRPTSDWESAPQLDLFPPNPQLDACELRVVRGDFDHDSVPSLRDGL